MSPPFPFVLVTFFFFVVGLGGLFLKTSALCGNARDGCNPDGDISDVFVYPFSYNDTDGDCGYPGLTYSCNDYRPVLNVCNDFYYVLSNNDDNLGNEWRFQYLRVVGVDVDEEECPRPMHNFTLPTTSPFSDPYKDDNNYHINYFYNCSSGYPKDVVQDLPCLDTYYNNNTTTPTGLLLRSFAFYSYKYSTDDRFNWYARNCEKNVVVPFRNEYNTSDLKRSLKSGFFLEWSTPVECKECEKSDGQCWFNHTTAKVYHYACSCPQHGVEDNKKDDVLNNTVQRKLFDKVCPPTHNISQQGPTANTSQSNIQTGPTTKSHQTPNRAIRTQLKIIIFGVCSGVGALLLVALFICRQKVILLYGSIISHWDSKIKSPTNMEAFLESSGCHGLQRYKYSQVKKITNKFKEKLGQGGFGSVFKGKLPDGRLVAVKLLDESKGNGQDFINEVATIGWTNHINVVRLLGFCCNGNKQALVYEFMPNGSLEKFIYNRENTSITNTPLGWEKLYQITLGIAKGLEYLHCGCNTRILHFDIKPHNILLDQDFCPKISDFGLAKLCQTRESIVSMHMARGTMGYIAPEVTCINFGGVSHKSDIYSYGMMILEMIGGRKNIDTTMENISEIYFPKWIYNHLIHDTNIDEHKEIFKEDLVRKMVIVALHSIQTQPVDRPSIRKVVEMLEADVGELQMPPNPFQDPPKFSP